MACSIWSNLYYSVMRVIESIEKEELIRKILRCPGLSEKDATRVETKLQRGKMGLDALLGK